MKQVQIDTYWLIDALSFYGSKMILNRSNNFGRVPTILDAGPNHFAQVQIMKISPEKSNLNPTKMICKVPDQSYLYPI